MNERERINHDNDHDDHGDNDNDITPVRDFIIAIPISLLYTLFVYKLSQIVGESLPYKQRLEQSLLILFFVALVGFIMGRYVFRKQKQTHNRVRYGLYISSLLLWAYTLGLNWVNIHEHHKLIIAGVLFAALVAMAI